LEIRKEVGGVLIAHVTVLLESFVYDGFHFGRQFRIHPRRRSGLTIENRIKNHSRGIAAERQCAGCHFIEHDSKGKQVASSVDLLSSDLFWRHVSQGSGDGVSAG